MARTYRPVADPAKRRLREPGLARLAIDLRVSEEVLRAFRDAAKERKLSTSDALREAIEQWVRRQALRE